MDEPVTDAQRAQAIRGVLARFDWAYDDYSLALVRINEIMGPDWDGES